MNSSRLTRIGCDNLYKLVTEAPQPPSSNTGVESTNGQNICVHYLSGTFSMGHEELLELLEDLLPGSYVETKDYGGNGYKKKHIVAHGMQLYFEPSTDEMPPVFLNCPGQACEALGFANLQTLFCNAVNLTRADVAFDHAPFTPQQAAAWVREENIRTRAQSRHFTEDLGKNPDGNTLVIGSRSSEQYLRTYDGRGFTRVELELKGDMARNFKDVLLSSPEEFVSISVGILREFVDFVDMSQTANKSNKTRAPLLPLWEQFTQGLGRVKLRVDEQAVYTLEQCRDWLEHQVSAMLYTFAKAGGSVGELLKLGKQRTKRKHRLLLASAGAS